MPNVSEGRDPEVIDACARAIAETGARLAHRTSDAIHNRSVFTYFGERDAVIAAAVALARVTTERIDLRRHAGAHPRIGALDVLPFVPFGDAAMDDAIAVAHDAAQRIWEATRVPSFLYGEAATREEFRALPAVRSGGFEGLPGRRSSGLRPDVGDDVVHASAGAIAVGARAVLVAFNVVLSSADVRLARRIARRLRESGGGLKTVRALGIALGNGRVQVSCNVTDAQAVPLDRVLSLVRRAAARAGVEVVGTELIGLVPRSALAAVVRRRLAF